MFGEMTPVKACGDFNYDISDNGRMVFLNFATVLDFYVACEIISNVHL